MVQHFYRRAGWNSVDSAAHDLVCILGGLHLLRWPGRRGLSLAGVFAVDYVWPRQVQDQGVSFTRITLDPGRFPWSGAVTKLLSPDLIESE